MAYLFNRLRVAFLAPQLRALDAPPELESERSAPRPSHVLQAPDAAARAEGALVVPVQLADRTGSPVVECVGCRGRDAVIAELRQERRELRGLLARASFGRAGSATRPV
jgi:hypothetical protein